MYQSTFLAYHSEWSVLTLTITKNIHFLCRWRYKRFAPLNTIQYLYIFGSVLAVIRAFDTADTTRNKYVSSFAIVHDI